MLTACSSILLSIGNTNFTKFKVHNEFRTLSQFQVFNHFENKKLKIPKDFKGR